MARSLNGTAPPEDFTAFVRAHEEDLRRACYGLTGDDQLVDGLERDMLGALARRWPRLRRDRSGGKAIKYVNLLLDRESPNWPRDDSAVGGGGDGPRVTPADQEQPPRADPAQLAESVWATARQRPPGRSRLLILVGLAIVGALLIPHPEPVPAPLPPPPDAPIVVPDIVQILQPIQLLGNVSPLAPLPETIDPDARTALSGRPGIATAVVALAQHEADPIVAVTPDGRRFRLDQAGLSGAKLWPTSLSPDGRRAVLTAPGASQLVDLATGKVTRVAGPVGAGPLWRDDSAFLLPGPDSRGAVEYSITGGPGVALSGFDPARLVTGQQLAFGQSALVELAGSPPASPARIRQLTPLAAGGPVQDEGSVPVVGAAWLGPWRGHGYHNGSVLLATADPSNLLLPPNTGEATDGVFAIDERTGQVMQALILGQREATLEVLGWLPGRIALVKLSWSRGARLLSWNLEDGTVSTVTGVLATATVSVRHLS